MRDRLLSRLGEWVVGHVWWVLVAALALTAAAGALLPRLDILTSRSALYPKDVEVNQRWDAYLENFATTNSLIAVVEGEPDDLGPFAELLAAELREQDEVIRSVFYKADIEFFADRAFLFLPLEQLGKLRDRVVEHRAEVDRFARIDGLVPLLEALSKLDSSTAFEEKIDIDTATKILAAVLALFEEFERWLDDPARNEIDILNSVFVEELSGRDYDLSGYMRSRDKRMLFVFIQPASNSEEFDAVHALVEAARGAAARASETWRGEGGEATTAPSVGLTGLPKIADEETLAIRHDVVFTASVATVLILFIILIGFRSVRRGLLVLVPMLLAGLWNLGLTVFTVGHLTILTAGITAVLFGLGVDYGIFLSGLIEENRRKGMDSRRAVVEAVRFGGRTLVTAGGTTTLAFFVIGRVQFTGFAEMGIVTGTGVLLVLLAMLFLLPALSMLFPARVRPSRGRGMEAAAANLRPPVVFTGLITFVALGVTALCLVAAFPFEIDFNVMNIMPKGSEAISLQNEMAERSEFSPNFVAAIAADEAEARAQAAALSALPTVARVESVTMLLPEDQEEKIALMREMGGIFDKIKVSEDDPDTGAMDLAEALDAFYDPLEDAQERAFAGNQKEIVKGLDEIIVRMDAITEKLEKDPDATPRVRAFERALFEVIRDAVAQIERWTEVGPVVATGLPPDILNKFQGRDGRFVSYVFPTGSIYDVDFLDEFLGEVYEVTPDATGFPTTHQVFSRMIFDGFLQAMTYAVLVVFFMLLFDFRSLGYTLAAFLPLGLGAAWMLGLMVLFGISHNYANIIALPLVIGLAVDYGVFITHRLRAEQNLRPFVTIQKAGRAVILAALTTLAGIGAICLGDHQGAASLGKVLILGIFSCLVAAIVVLPVIASLVRDLMERRGAGSKKKEV